MLQESLSYWSLCLSDVALCTNGTIQFVNDILVVHLPSIPAWQAMHRPLLGHCGGSRAERVRIDLSVGPLLCAIRTFTPDFWTTFLTIRETKNIIYKLDCAICAESYIGETKRPVRERLLEHRRAALNDEQNPWGAHYGTTHNGSPVPTIPFTARVIRRAQDHVDRKLGEAIEIRSRDNTTTEHRQRMAHGNSFLQ